jgi:hypothetical protein
LPHQSVQADAIGLNLGIAFVRDCFGIEQCEHPQRRHRLVKAFPVERRGEWLAELAPTLREQEQRDWLGSEQRRMND